MKNRINNYIDYCDKHIENHKIDKQFCDDILHTISFFQHERLIHLIVTLFIGLMAIIFFISSIYFQNIYLLIILFIFIGLFIPYILHYYFLENNVQKLYDIYKNVNSTINKIK